MYDLDDSDARFDQLEELGLGYGLTDSGVNNMLSRCNRLQLKRLDLFNYSGQALPAEFIFLEKLALKGGWDLRGILDRLGGGTHLKSLHLTQPAPSCFAGNLLESVDKLETLEVRECPNLAALCVIQALGCLPKLKSLKLRRAGIIDACIVPEMFGLQKLDLSFCRNIENLFLLKIKSHQLRHLDLTYTGVSGKEVNTELPQLEHLNLSGCRDIRCVVKFQALIS